MRLCRSEKTPFRNGTFKSSIDTGRYIQVQQSVAQSLKSDYIAVGEEWDDKQYQNLGAVIDQAVAALSSNYATLSECTTRLLVLRLTVTLQI